ncbi:MAG: transcription elongation factor [Mangrovimonas sp.]|nr:transcription elongation factor [Mangrovimonas sp.]MCB0438167.1 transcription elongation factor [Mangrovimonas sp.]HPF98161.1 transcription elongation factor [Mangrovimonas sp.]
MSEKEMLLQACYGYVNKRIDSYKNEIETIKDAIENNKSSDDEDDSGSGKLMHDLEKNMQYLSDAAKMKDVLNQINPKSSTSSVGLGSIVKTTTNCFFISISAGEIKLENKSVYAISMGSPIGLALSGKSPGEQLEFNGNKIKIDEIK